VPEHAHHARYKKIGESHAQKNAADNGLVYFSIVELVCGGKNAYPDQRCQQEHSHYATQFLHPFNF